MSENKLVGEFRTTFGKGSARKSRAAGRTPAVIYGHGSEPRHITLPAHEIALVLRHKNAIIELDLNGKKETVLVKSASKFTLKFQYTLLESHSQELLSI
jgi:large subunit ribosomal protein L25